MTELSFTIMADNDSERGYFLPLIREFETQQHVQVNLNVLHWNTGWSDLVKYAVYNHGPDVSEIGSTWIGSLASLNSLRSFENAEIQSMGGAQSFLPSAWNTGAQAGSDEMWSIPWKTYANILFFRKDWLEKSGIRDPYPAFETHEALETTLDVLRKSGISYPWAAMALRTHVILHDTSSWIWAEGGDWLTPGTKEVSFNHPEAFRGLRKYFGLRRFLSPEIHLKVSPFDLFYQEKTASVVGGPWLWKGLKQVIPETHSHWGITQVPGGISYLGGIGLGIWKHSKQPEAALELVRFLLNNGLKVKEGEHAVYFPSRLEEIQLLSGEPDLLLQEGIRAIQNARTFPTIRLWGLIEENLMDSLSKVWYELISNPSSDVDEVLHRNLDFLASKMNAALAG